MAKVFAMPMPAKANERLMLLALADNANDQGTCWPSITHLAEKCATSRRSAIRTLNALVDAKLITREKGKGVSTTYHITLPTSDVHGTTSTSDVHGTSDVHDTTTSDVHGIQLVTYTSPKPSGTINKEPSIDSSARAKKIPSDVEEVRAYAIDAALPDLSDAFFDNFTANGWVTGRGKAPMKDWRAAYRNWCRREKEFNPSTTNGRPKKQNEWTAADHEAARAEAFRIAGIPLDR